MERKNVILCVALMAIVIGELSGKPNQITKLDKQMTAKAKAKNEKTSPGNISELDPLVEPASGVKVEIIKEDAVELEDVQADQSGKNLETNSDDELSKMLDDNNSDVAKNEVKNDEANVEANAVSNADEQADEKREKRSKMNNYRSNFAYACPNGRSISTLLSAFHPSLRDRQWTARCDKLLPSGSTGPRFWTTNNGYDNEYKGTMNAYCPPQSVMTGLAGYWRQGSYDRRFKLLCTHVWHHKKTSCKWSPWMNNWKESAHFTLGCNDRYYVVGMNSYYHKSYYDRRFRLYMCKLQKI